MIFTTSERLILRRPEPGDHDAFVRSWSAPEMTCYTGTRPNIDEFIAIIKAAPTPPVAKAELTIRNFCKVIGLGAPVEPEVRTCKVGRSSVQSNKKSPMALSKDSPSLIRL